MQSVKVAALWIARIEMLGAFVGFVFEHGSRLLPFTRRAETPEVLCFDHPVPMAPLHLLIVPKKRIRSLEAAVADARFQTLREILCCAEIVAARYAGSFRLEVNNGTRQEVKQLHFHLLRNLEATSLTESEERSAGTLTIGALQGTVFKSKTEGHRIRVDPSDGIKTLTMESTRDWLIDSLGKIMKAQRELQLTNRGFTVSLALRVGATIEWRREILLSADA